MRCPDVGAVAVRMPEQLAECAGDRSGGESTAI
jgi:hypothetical protein